MTPSSALFLSTTVMGTMISISSNNWLYLWMGMELNLLSFVPIMNYSDKLQETMGSVKYFLIQAIGSGLMLTAGISAVNPYSAFNYFIISFMFIMSMCMKLGAAPYHQWLPHVMTSLPWSTCIPLATWQKISPFMMLMLVTPSEMYFMITVTATLSAVIGGLGGMNQSQMRALMAYSSIGHMGWMLATLVLSNKLSLIYLLIYLMITFSLMMMTLKTNTLMSQLHNSLHPTKSIMFLMIIIMLLSLGGLPPFLGFVPKWMVICALTEESLELTVFMLILGSMINLFYYFSMMFNFLMSSRHTILSFTPPLWAPILTSTMTVIPALLLL